MTKIAVSGGLGRMGRRICRIVADSPEAELSAVIESPGFPETPGSYLGAEVTTGTLPAGEADVVIDFSHPLNTLDILDECVRSETKLVIGTTGFDEGQLDKIKSAASETAVLLSPNMSIGVNLLFRIAGIITESLPDFEKEIVEAHHNRKADAPSGTALKIAEIISRAGDEVVNGRSGKPGPRKKGEIGVHAVRGGGITGEHTVMWIGEHERIELFHRAETRGIFASGAVRAALWLKDRPSGKLYSMEDVLK